jgi:tetratricopeptide (TPR) repeat protein
VADIIRSMAGFIKQTNVKQAIGLFISSRELSERLGYQHMIGLVQQNLGMLMQLRGELNAAIEYHLDYRKIRESLGLDTRYMACLIACMYSQIGKGEDAFELAKTAVDFANSSSTIWLLSRPHAELAWALINLGRYDEAEAELATAYEIATKSGDFAQMMWVQLVEGILDKAESNFDSANLIFKELLNDLENDPVPMLQNTCLLNLTEIEIEMLTDVFLKNNSDISGPWMTRLVEHAEKNDLPGIAARALLLQAELLRKQGRFDEVRKTLKEVQRTAKASSMRYLNDLIVSMFTDIIVT